MITALLSRLRADLADIRAQVKTSVKFRALLAGPKKTDPDIVAIAAEVPASAAWAVYDHGAAVTRLYAVYERFIENLVAEWLSLLPVLWPKYDELDERIRRTHREGVGRMLSTLHYRRNRSVDPVGLIKGLLQGISTAPYSVDPVAFIQTERNYKPDVLRTFFNSVGIEDSWSWVDEHAVVQEYIGSSTRPDPTLENALADFVNYRNDAAHGLADDILGADALLELVDLVEAISIALAELVRDRIVQGLLKVNQAIELGVITEVFRGSGAVVAKCAQGTISTGDSLIVCGKRVCREVSVATIQMNDQPCYGVSILHETEVGLAIGEGMRRNWKLIRVPQESDA
jgi:hypothetical protein